MENAVTLGCPGQEVLGSKVIGSVGYNPNILLLQVGYKPLILTIDPNFQRDI